MISVSTSSWQTLQIDHAAPADFATDAGLDLATAALEFDLPESDQKASWTNLANAMSVIKLDFSEPKSSSLETDRLAASLDSVAAQITNLTVGLTPLIETAAIVLSVGAIMIVVR